LARVPEVVVAVEAGGLARLWRDTAHGGDGSNGLAAADASGRAHDLRVSGRPDDRVQQRLVQGRVLRPRRAQRDRAGLTTLDVQRKLLRAAFGSQRLGPDLSGEVPATADEEHRGEHGQHDDGQQRCPPRSRRAAAGRVDGQS